MGSTWVYGTLKHLDLKTSLKWKLSAVGIYIRPSSKLTNEEPASVLDGAPRIYNITTYISAHLETLHNDLGRTIVLLIMF